MWRTEVRRTDRTLMDAMNRIAKVSSQSGVTRPDPISNQLKNMKVPGTIFDFPPIIEKVRNNPRRMAKISPFPSWKVFGGLRATKMRWKLRAKNGSGNS